MSDTAAILVAIVGTIGTIGAGLVAAIVQMRRSRAAGVREKHVHEAEHSLARDQHDLAVLREGMTFLREEVTRLRATRIEDREELRAQRDRIELLEETAAAERHLTTVALTYIRSVHEWIKQHMPGTEPPPLPDDLKPHVTIPKEGDS